ncbi:hypothetical protein MPC4_340029 [Methylocella tundrae]|uniref:Uncharacterized protein n=1 Tax=Methylocella tundrae TaxID=227605 RepID=A0A8B6M8C0_METTU|nr:hypothetical protein MPC1_8140002 [Methylocella tundrae]VTZ51273.1 hypothetical protein MPC4_340029 [Methylocella tundrae]
MSSKTRTTLWTLRYPRWHNFLKGSLKSAPRIVNPKTPSGFLESLGLILIGFLSGLSLWFFGFCHMASQLGAVR